MISWRPEPVVVSIGGQNFTQWEEISVHASVKEACRELALSFCDQLSQPTWPTIFKGNPLLTVTASGETVFTGYVDRIHPTLAPNSFRVGIGARAKGQDAIDCSCDHTKPDYVKRTALEIAKDQDKFGVGFSADCRLEPIPRWRPNVGDTLFNALRPLCEDAGATMSGQADGSIRITQAGATAKPQGAPIIEGQNLWKIAAVFDDRAKHSKVKAHGQSYKGSGAQALEIEAQAENDTVGRERLFHEHHDRDTDRSRVSRRARRRRDKEAGESTRAVATMRGWRDYSGMLWTPGNKVFVQSPSVGLQQSLLIESVAYRQSGHEHEGTFVVMHLVDPRAHGGSGGGVNQSGDAWGFDDSAAS